MGHRFSHPGALGERKIEKKYGVTGRETAFWSKIMGALGENVIFGLSVRAAPVPLNNPCSISNFKKKDCAQNHLK